MNYEDLIIKYEEMTSKRLPIDVTQPNLVRKDFVGLRVDLSKLVTELKVAEVEGLLETTEGLPSSKEVLELNDNDTLKLYDEITTRFFPQFYELD